MYIEKTLENEVAEAQQKDQKLVDAGVIDEDQITHYETVTEGDEVNFDE